jgi:pilus assembly protein Flp/PilA
MAMFVNWLARFFTKDEEGQGLVEYALILFLVAIVCIAVLFLLGGQIQSVFSQVSGGLANPGGS